jgi:hypothetical protein
LSGTAPCESKVKIEGLTAVAGETTIRQPHHLKHDFVLSDILPED